MKPRLFTLRNFFLLLVAAGIFGGLAYWIHEGMPLPGQGVPSTKGKIAFISTRGGHPDIYMMDGADGGNAVALTNDPAEDSEPVWSPNGNEIAFISRNRAGETAQAFLMDAKPAAHPVALANTSMSKSEPIFGEKKKVYYLASGRLAATTTDDFDTDMLFPDHDAVRSLYGDSDHPGMLSTGGIQSVAIRSAGDLASIVIKTENGEGLLAFEVGNNTAAALALGKKIMTGFLPDGKLLAVIVNGASLPQPLGIFDEKVLKTGQTIPPLNLPIPESQTTLLVTYDLSSGKVEPLTAIPVNPEGFAISPDGSHVVFTVEKPVIGPSGEPTSVIVMPLAGGAQPTFLFSKGAKEPTWSPDGTEIAFVSGDDIYVIPAGGGEAKNLTQGKGSNSQPAWSPARK